jgi:hypothetical protein
VNLKKSTIFNKNFFTRSALLHSTEEATEMSSYMSLRKKVNPRTFVSKEKQSTPRDELDVSRETQKWDEALQIAQRVLRNVKDNRLTQVIKGQQAYTQKNIAQAQEEWNTVSGDPNTKYSQV